MPKVVKRKPQKFTVDEVLSDEVDMPRKLELIEGIIGPFSDDAIRALLTNWGADRIVRLTGPEIWLEAAAAAAKKGT